MCMWIIPLPLLVRVIRLWVGKAEGDHCEYLQAKCLPSSEAQVQRQHGNCWMKTLYRYKAISAHMWRCYIMAKQVASAFVTNFHNHLKRPLIPTNFDNVIFPFVVDIMPRRVSWPTWRVHWATWRVHWM